MTETPELFTGSERLVNAANKLSSALAPFAGSECACFDDGPECQWCYACTASDEYEAALKDLTGDPLVPLSEILAELTDAAADSHNVGDRVTAQALTASASFLRCRFGAASSSARKDTP